MDSDSQASPHISLPINITCPMEWVMGQLTADGPDYSVSHVSDEDFLA